ncbi:hypothetical protein VPH35_073229 [Triticum aestivum]
MFAGYFCLDDRVKKLLSALVLFQSFSYFNIVSHFGICAHPRLLEVCAISALTIINSSYLNLCEIGFMVQIELAISALTIINSSYLNLFSVYLFVLCGQDVSGAQMVGGVTIFCQCELKQEMFICF